MWRYVEREAIPVPPLYFAREMLVVERVGALIAVHDERMRLHPGEVPAVRRVRFRSLGCYPLTAAVPSEATTLAEVAAETLAARVSERGGRLIDRDASDTMEHKKREGYF